MSENLLIYKLVQSVPAEAQKSICGGRLKGMTDINPMWRLKMLTEVFGPCGFGWRYEITDKRIEKGPNDESAAFVDINLYVKHNGEWSCAIPGTGGSSFVAQEKNGLYMSDECFKMALTDAISISCKSLGFGADVYWAAGRTKYTAQPNTTNSKENAATGQQAANNGTETTNAVSEPQLKRLYAIAGSKGKKKDIVNAEILKNLGVAPEAMSKSQYNGIVAHYEKLPDATK